MRKKTLTDKALETCPKNCFGRVVEGLFLCKAAPKRECLSYLIEIGATFHTSDVCFLIIAIRYDECHFFDPALDKNKLSTTRPRQGFFGTPKLVLSVDLFFSIIS